ncbi:MAG: GAF domain-containing protein [Anaerolineae bacterium]|nr:GAF domain-containing protein [Anaerolineae bacterium]
MRTSAILIASAQGPELKKILEAEAGHHAWPVELWRSDTPLVDQLSEQVYAVLLIEVELLPQMAPADSFLAGLTPVAPQTTVLVLAKPNQRQQAIAQLQHGAADYLLFPITGAELVLKLERILEIQALKQGQSPTQFKASANELLLLSEAGQEINQSLELDEVLKIVLSRAENTTGANLAGIYLADRNENLNKNEIVTRTSSLFSSLTRENDLLFALAQNTALEREICCCQKTSAPEWQNQSLQSALLIPMVSGDRLIGVLALGSNQLSAFPDHQVRWLSVFCDRAAIAIENAYLFQSLSSAYIDLAQSREKILHSRNTLQVLFDGITDDLYIVDQDLTINALNRVSMDQQQYQPDDLIGKSYLSLGWTSSEPELLERIREALETGQETTWIPPENETEPYLKDREFRIYPIRNRLGQVEQAIVFAQDVSERRHLQASLFRSANLVAIGQLAGSVAHQINNPLTVAMANSQLVLLEVAPNSEVHELTNGIYKATERIQSIVKNLLEFSNQETYFFVETNLIDTIEDALALVIRSLKKVKIEVSKDYQAQPRLSASVSHLKLVWMNLLLNARDAVAGYAERPQITISTQMVSDREVQVTISDNGQGITAEGLEQLFRPFFTTKPVGKALGLGLYSVHAIIERHHGQIKASSRPGGPTSFEVILPLDNPRDL